MGEMQMWLTGSCLSFLAGGAGYVLLELLYRGRSHGCMFLCGGVCVALIGMLNEFAPALPLSVQALLGACIITGAELVFGLAFNRSFAIWDYRALPHNFRGQICPQFFGCWVILSPLAVLVDDALRALLGAPLPHYVLF